MTSPRPNSPLTSTTPIGSSDLPSVSQLGTAPASSITLPAVCRWSAIHCLRAVSCAVCAVSCGADRLAGRQSRQHVDLRGPRQ